MLLSKFYVILTGCRLKDHYRHSQLSVVFWFIRSLGTVFALSSYHYDTLSASLFDLNCVYLLFKFLKTLTIYLPFLFVFAAQARSTVIHFVFFIEADSNVYYLFLWLLLLF